MTELIFHEPWWLLGVVVVGGIVTLVVGNRRMDKMLQRIGITAALLAVLLGALRFIFPTFRERMEIRTKAIIHAVDSRDWNALSSLLDPTTAVGNRSHVLKAGRNAIVDLTKADTELYNVRSLAVIGMDSAQTDTLITVAVEVYSVQDPTQGRPETSSWQFDYQQNGDEWILEKITLLRLGTQAGQQEFPPMNLPA
jgi:hypothetical protein